MKKFTAILVCMILILGAFSTLTAAQAASKEITITGSSVVAKGKTVTLKADQDVTWNSSDKKIATVSSSGKVKGIKAGKVTITATAKNGKAKASWKMTVMKKAASKVTIQNKADILQVGESYELQAKASPSEAGQAFTWKSSNTKVAKVTADGTVTALKEGKAKITATASDGSGKKATVTLKVEKKTQGNKIGISMPTKDLQRWKQDGENMQKRLQEAGFNVVLQFASNDVQTQLMQIETMIDNGCDVIVITAINGSGLGQVLDKAGKKGVKVIAYDRLLMDNANVDYYVTFSNYKVGTLQGNYVKNALKLDEAKGPFYMEITAGDPGDYNGHYFYLGAIDVLKPYIDAGKIIVRSGQTEFDQVATPTWRTEVAQERADDILASYYAKGEKLDAWLCVNDSTALGVTNALKNNYAGKGWPIITGQDCDITNVKNILAGKQSMSVFRDTRILVDRAVTMIKQILAGEKVQVNDTSTYNNNVKVVPTFLCDPSYVHAGNYKEMLIDSGYYTADQLR